GSRGRRRMSSSSAPDAPQLDAAGLEEAEELERDQRTAALGAKDAVAEQGGGWLTTLWALPGALWLGFYLVAPLVFIVLVSFWTRTDTGFVRPWTGRNTKHLITQS